MRSRTAARRFALSMSLMAGLAATVASWPVDAFAQSRAADALREHYRPYLRQFSAADVNRYVHFDGDDGLLARFANGQSIRISYGMMWSAAPGAGVLIHIDESIFNDTSEPICVRMKMRDRNPFRFPQTVINDEFSFIVEPHSRHTLSAHVGRYGARDNFPQPGDNFHRLASTVMVWLPDMSQPSGSGRRCGMTEPAFVQQELRSTPSAHTLRFGEDIQDRFGRLLPN